MNTKAIHVSRYCKRHTIFCVLFAFAAFVNNLSLFGAQRDENPEVIEQITYTTDYRLCDAIVATILSANIEAFDAIYEEHDLDINDPLVREIRVGYGVIRCQENLRRKKLNLVRFVFNQWQNRNCVKPENEAKSVGFQASKGLVRPELGSIGVGGMHNCSSVLNDIVTPEAIDWVEGNTFYGTPLMIACRIGSPYMVSELLKRGANPNIVFKFGNVKISEISSLKNTERPYVCALTDAATVGIFSDNIGLGYEEKKSAQNIAQCISILRRAGAVLPPKDGMGRNALWDALIHRNETLLNIALASGIDINSRDNHGKTVLDYCVRAAGDKSRQRSDRMACERFAAFVRKAGGTCAAESEVENEDTKSEDESAAKIQSQDTRMSGGNSGSTGNYVMPRNQSYAGSVSGIRGNNRIKVDHTAEKKSLEHQLQHLRRELLDAERDQDKDAILGLGMVRNDMRYQNILRKIQEIEHKLLQFSQED